LRGNVGFENPTYAGSLKRPSPRQGSLKGRLKTQTSSLKASTPTGKTFMSFQLIMFYTLAAIILFGALKTVTAKNPVHAALYLVLTFCMSASSALSDVSAS